MEIAELKYNLKINKALDSCNKHDGNERKKSENLKTEKLKRERTGKKKLKTEPKDLYDNIERSKIEVIGTLKETREWGKRKKEIEEILTKILPHLMIHIYIFKKPSELCTG